MHIYARCMCISMHIHAYLCISMHIYAHLCIGISAYLCTSMHIYAYLCISMYIYAYLCICTSMHIYSCLCISMHTYAYLADFFGVPFVLGPVGVGGGGNLYRITRYHPFSLKTLIFFWFSLIFDGLFCRQPWHTS